MKLFLASKQPGKSCILALLALALTACGGGDGDDAAPNDTSAPVLSELTAVGAHTSDNTPNYVFRSSEAGRISYSGGCVPTGLTAFAGENTATFRALADGTYDTCRITVTDAAGNESGSLSVTSFTVDTVAPTLIEQTAVTTPTRIRTPAYVFSSNEGGTITYGGACSADVASAVNGQNQITFNALDDGTYRNCTITVTDLAGNASTLAVREFTIDNVAPVLVERTPVVTPLTTPPSPPPSTRDNTPNYEFSSTEAGVITYGGACASTNLSAIRTNNVVTFNTLSDGVYNDCTITVTDLAGNASLALSVSPFAVNTAVPTLLHVTAVPSPTNDNTPNYTFNSSSAGQISFVNGSCRSATTTAVAGNNTLTFNPLSDGIHDCTIRVTDELGNPSALLAIPAFTIDTTGPTLTQVSAISTYTNNASPSYRFTSNESSAIVYGGDCAAYSPSAVVDGNIIVSFLNLVDRAYINCTLTMQDALGNTSTLAIPGFTVDTIAPVLVEVTPVVASSNDITPNYTFSSSETGAITYGGSCASPTISAVIGNNAITFNALTHGTYSNCTIRVTDVAGNVSSLLNITSFDVITDFSAPVLTEVTPVASGNDTTPNYTFSTTEAGTITYGGSCASATTTAVTGSNTITFNLAVGFYQDCTLTVTDAAGLVSNVLDVSAFLIGKPLNDTGITLCGDYAYDDISAGYNGSNDHSNSIDCANEASPSSTATQEGFEIENGNDVVPAGQDAVYGRDTDDDANDDSDGHKGFNFTKLGAGGEVLASDASTWSCVRDNVTGLVWEVKTDDGGLRDKDWTYTWYNSTGVNDGGDRGVGDTGVGTTTGYENNSDTFLGSDNCANPSRCDTEKFVADVNASTLCGANNWRLPTSAELKNLLHLGADYYPVIDTDFFPNTVWIHWTASPSALFDDSARVVNFLSGYDTVDDKHLGNYVRLVRSNQ